MKKCEARTSTGRQCLEWVAGDETSCTYHSKVAAGLIAPESVQADPDRARELAVKQQKRIRKGGPEAWLETSGEAPKREIRHTDKGLCECIRCTDRSEWLKGRRHRERLWDLSADAALRSPEGRMYGARRHGDFWEEAGRLSGMWDRDDEDEGEEGTA
jgi:hypothetical protein